MGAYAWRSLLNTGVIIPNGSDFPVERVNPLYSFHAAVSRQDDDNWPPGGWFPEQTHDPRRGAQGHDDLAGVRGVPGTSSWARSPRASMPISSSSTATS